MACIRIGGRKFTEKSGNKKQELRLVEETDIKSNQYVFYLTDIRHCQSIA